MKYSKDYLDRLSVAVYEAAEALGTELGQESASGHSMMVVVDDDYYEFKVDYIVSNFREELDTNSVTYDVTITCVDIPRLNEFEIFEYLYNEFHLEVLYEHVGI